MTPLGHSEEVPYATTIVQARYGGSYEGGKWVAIYCYHAAIPESMDGDDLTCSSWWDANSDYVGVGDSPNDALADLAVKGFPRVPELVGKELGTVTAIPRDELLTKLREMMPDPPPRYPNSQGGYAEAVEALIEWAEAWPEEDHVASR